MQEGDYGWCGYGQKVRGWTEIDIDDGLMGVRIRHQGCWLCGTIGYCVRLKSLIVLLYFEVYRL